MQNIFNVYKMTHSFIFNKQNERIIFNILSKCNTFAVGNEQIVSEKV